MKLIIYSGGQERSNSRIHRALSNLVGRKRRKHFTYIPVWSESSHIFYNRIVRRYSRFGFTDFLCLPVDEKISVSDLKLALKGDVIYLAGGNTFYFLHHIKKAGLFPKLRAFAKKGGVLVGLSAGGLILTSHVALAGYPTFDADENEVGLKDLRGLGLTKFEFFPHYYRSKKLDQALLIYSESSRFPIYALYDGSGIVVKGRELRVLGSGAIFYKGKKREI